MTENDAFDPARLLLEADASDPYETYVSLHERCPVARSQVEGFSMVYLSRYEDVAWALRHPEIFSSEGDPMGLAEQPMIPLQVDPPEHTRYRRLVSPQFSPRQVKRLEPEIRRLVQERIAGFADRGECDFHAEFATPLPTSFFLALMGLPLDDLELFLRWRDDTIRPAGDAEAAAQTRKRVGAEISQYFRDALAGRGRMRNDGLLSGLINIPADDHELTEGEILGISHLLLIAGLDTVTAALDCVFSYLARHPDKRGVLVANERMIPGAVEELLRSETPVTLTIRTVTQPATVSGVDLNPGEQVALVLGAANVDAHEFEDPGVSFERHPNRHVAFGTGNHFCLGAHLAKAELRIAIEEFHRRIPEYRIQPGFEPKFSAGIRQAQCLPLEWATSGRPST